GAGADMEIDDPPSEKKTIRSRRNLEKKEKRPRFSLTLSCIEIKDDFFAMTGKKLPRRPKRRSRAIQAQINQRVKRMASMNTRLNIRKLDGNIVRKHGGSKQVGFKQLGPVAQKWLEDQQPKEKTNMDCLRSIQQCTKSEVAKHLGVAVIQQQDGLVKETNVTLFAKARLKDDMDAQSNVYVLSNGCRKYNDDNDGYYWGCKSKIWVWEIVKDQSGNTLRVSQSKFYNGKLVQTLLEGHSILSLEGSISGDCDVEKIDVGMLDKFDRGLQTDVHVFVDFDYVMGRSITSGIHDTTEAAKKKIWPKGLLKESKYELRLVACISTGAMVKGDSRSEVPTQVKVAAYRY
nr:zinc finger, CCHC-type [Tanacetum cinerariifolium]